MGGPWAIGLVHAKEGCMSVLFAVLSVTALEASPTEWGETLTGGFQARESL